MSDANSTSWAKKSITQGFKQIGLFDWDEKALVAIMEGWCTKRWKLRAALENSKHASHITPIDQGSPLSSKYSINSSVS